MKTIALVLGLSLAPVLAQADEPYWQQWHNDDWARDWQRQNDDWAARRRIEQDQRELDARIEQLEYEQRQAEQRRSLDAYADTLARINAQRRDPLEMAMPSARLPAPEWIPPWRQLQRIEP